MCNLLFSIEGNIVNPSSRLLVDEGQERHPLGIPRSYKNLVHTDYSSSPSAWFSGKSSSCSLSSASEAPPSHSFPKSPSTASSGVSLHHSHSYKSQLSLLSSDSGTSPYSSYSHLSGNKSDGVLSTASSETSLYQARRSGDAHQNECTEHIGETATSSILKTLYKLNAEFVSLVIKVKDYIASHRINIQQTIVPFLINPPFHLKKQFKSFLKKRRQLRDLRSADELIDFISYYWDDFHPGLLFHLIERLNDKTLSEEALSYEKQLIPFEENTTIGEFAGKFKGRAYPEGQTIKFELSSNKVSWPLSHARTTIDAFGDVSNCDRPVRLQQAEVGSVFLTVTIPSPLDQEVFERKEVKEFLHAHEEILMVSINEDIVYNKVSVY